MSFWDNLLNTLTDFIQDTADAVTGFIQDTADAVTDFLESVGALTYGNYGGLNYSAGVVGGTITETSPPPVDAYDAAFYLHDLAYQSSSDPAVRLPADVQLAESLIDLEEQGGGSVNVLTGGDGDDIQVGGDGVDWIYGGLGNDQRLDGAAGTDGVFGGEGNDILVLGDGHDAGWGGAGNDIILADTGNDFLFGGLGDDWLYGGSGEDRLNAGPGVDGILTEAGNDTVFFDVLTSGLDVIMDGSFGPGDGDKIAILNGGEVSDFNAVISHAYQDGPYVVIAFNATTGIYINGYTIAQLAADDFLFA
jgi:RTX calcium-binding nonapeptide repeat (4 copies)